MTQRSDRRRPWLAIFAAGFSASAAMLTLVVWAASYRGTTVLGVGKQSLGAVGVAFSRALAEGSYFSAATLDWTWAV